MVNAYAFLSIFASECLTCSEFTVSTSTVDELQKKDEFDNEFFRTDNVVHMLILKILCILQFYHSFSPVFCYSKNHNEEI